MLPGWGVPFLWAGIWAAITVPWVRRVMHHETEAWEGDMEGIVPSTQMTPGPHPVANGDLEGNVEKPLDLEDAEIPELKPPIHPAHKDHAASENSSTPTAVEDRPTIHDLTTAKELGSELEERPTRHDPTTETEVPIPESERAQTQTQTDSASTPAVPAQVLEKEAETHHQSPLASQTQTRGNVPLMQPPEDPGKVELPPQSPLEQSKLDEDPAGLNLPKPA